MRKIKKNYKKKSKKKFMRTIKKKSMMKIKKKVKMILFTMKPEWKDFLMKKNQTQVLQKDNNKELDLLSWFIRNKKILLAKYLDVHQIQKAFLIGLYSMYYQQEKKDHIKQ